MTSHISYSELKEWHTCAWKHKLVYLNKIKQFIGNEHTSFGTALHSVCESLVLNKITPEEGKTLFLEEFLNELQTLKNKDPSLELNKELILGMKEQGQNLVQYVLPALKSCFGTFELISVEEKLYELHDKEHEYNFKGFIDLVVQTKDGNYHIIDWKTCSWGWDTRRKTDKITTYQLTLYKYFWAKKHKVEDRLIQTHFALMKRTASKKHIEIFKVSSGKRKTENAIKLLNKAIYNINKKSFIKNKLSCHGRYGMCEFYKTEHCP